MTEIFTAKHFYKKHESDLCAVYWKFHLFAKNMNYTGEEGQDTEDTELQRNSRVEGNSNFPTHLICLAHIIYFHSTFI